MRLFIATMSASESLSLSFSLVPSCSWSGKFVVVRHVRLPPKPFHIVVNPSMSSPSSPVLSSRTPNSQKFLNFFARESRSASMSSFIFFIFFSSSPFIAWAWSQTTPPQQLRWLQAFPASIHIEVVLSRPPPTTTTTTTTTTVSMYLMGQGVLVRSKWVMSIYSKALPRVVSHEEVRPFH